MLKTAKKGEFRLELSILGVFLGIFAIFFIGNPQVFSRFDIYYSFMSTIPFSGIMALAITFVIIAGEIDLSFPSILGFSAWVFSKIVEEREVIFGLPLSAASQQELLPDT